MSDFVIVTLIVTLFRTAMIIIGFGFAYLGYQLFVKGVYDKAGDLKAAWGDRNLILKQAAPGTFFALFGVAVIAISIVRGTGLESKTIVRQGANANAVVQAEYPPLKKLLRERGIKIEGTWEKAHLELAILHNMRLIFQKYGVSPAIYLETFNDVLVPILKETPGANRGTKLSTARGQLLQQLSKYAPAQLSSGKASADESETRTYKPGLGVD